MMIMIIFIRKINTLQIMAENSKYLLLLIINIRFLNIENTELRYSAEL